MPPDEAQKLRQKQNLKWNVLVMGDVEAEWYLQTRCPSWKTFSFLTAGAPGLDCWGVRTSFWGSLMRKNCKRAQYHPLRQTASPGRQKDSQGPWECPGELALCQGKRQPTDTGKCQGDLLAAAENKCWKNKIIVKASQQNKGCVGTHQNLIQFFWPEQEGNHYN